MRFVNTLAICGLLTVASVGLADEAEAIAAIEKLGGTVRQIAQDSENKEAAFHLSGKELTDDGLAHLKEVQNLVWLNLANTKITDDDARTLAGKVQRLDPTESAPGAGDHGHLSIQNTHGQYSRFEMRPI